jgi:hypothetical protein
MVNEDQNFDANIFEHSLGSTCELYTANLFGTHVQRDDSQLLLIHHNIRSFHKNYDELSVFLDQLNSEVGVIVLTETWFSPILTYDIEGFTAYHTYRSDKRGGGVSVFVRESIKATPIVNLNFVNEIFEVCSVKLTFSRRTSVNIVGIYRPPDRARLADFNIALYNDVLSLFRPTDQIILTGDFNIDLFQLDDHGRTFVENLQSNSFLPVISKPTHVSDNRASLLDHLWTNHLGRIISGVFDIDITDHKPIFAIFTFNMRNEIIRKIFRDHSRQSLEVLKNKIESLSFNNQNGASTDFHAKVHSFQHKIYEIYDECCPIRSKTLSRNRYLKPYITDAIITSVNRKHELYREYRRGTVTQEFYKQYRNILTYTLRRAKILYFRDRFENCQGDIKKTWKNLNYLLKPKSKSTSIPEIIHNGNSVNDPMQIAARFNEYFSSIGEQLDRSIPPSMNSPLDYMGPPNLNSFFCSPVTVADVSEIIKSFPNKGCPTNFVPAYVFKIISPYVCQPIADIFNESISLGIFPDCLKIARVVPIFKTGDRMSVTNYRPISTLPVLAKIFEKLMSIKIKSFLSVNSILCKHQFGFRAGAGTADAILQFTDNVYDSLNNKESLAAVFLDFSKAFDTVNHRVLLSKLSHIGVRGAMHDWFRSYLNNRLQYVSLGTSANSDSTTVNLGVPQGSILGPLLFLIYINDMSHSAESLQFIHFADDTTVFISGLAFDEVFRVMNEGLSTVDGWLIANRLSLNIAKTSYMLITNRTQPQNIHLQIRGTDIARETKAKFLGVIIDHKLNFKDHVDNLCIKLSKSLGIMYRIAPFVPRAVMLNLYYSIFYPHMTYAITTWGMSSLGNRAKIKRLQNRVLSFLPAQANTSVLTTNRILTFENSFFYFILLHFHKILHSADQNHFICKIQDCIPRHQYSTRFVGSERINFPQFRLTSSKASFLYNAIRAWNAIPVTLKNTVSVNIFKRNLKTHLQTN